MGNAEEEQAGEPSGSYVWQPPARGAWTPDWVRDAVFYQIFPDRFARSGEVPEPGPFEPWEAPPTPTGIKGGDLAGITAGLDRLADLGITALYLNPVFTSASNHRYHTDDYLAVDPLLGGDEALRRLLDAAHERGMRVILDGVFNHTGRGHQPFVHVLENGASSPYRGWYHFDQARLDQGRGLTPYLPAGDQPDTFARAGYEAWWGLPALPKLDHADPHVRDFLYRVAQHWMAFGADGWRLDVPGEIRQEGFWEGFREHVRSARPEAYLVGEVWSVDPAWLAGDRFDGLMHYPLTEAILSFVGGDHLDLATVGSQHEYATHVRAIDGPTFADQLSDLLRAYDPAATACQLNLLGSHDTPRFRTVCGGEPAAYRLATLLQMTLPGAPCIYYGDELGLEGGADPDNRRSYPLDETVGDQGLRTFVASAIALRRAHPCLRDTGTWQVAGAQGPAFAQLRQADDEAFVVALNAGDAPSSLTLSLPGLAGRQLTAKLWASGPKADAAGSASGVAGSPPTVAPDGHLELSLPARDGVVLQAT